MRYEIRALTVDDLPASWELTRIAFGAAIATLFRTSPLPYRRLDCEEVGALTWTTVPASALRGVAMPEGVTLRPAGPDDVPAVELVDAARARRAGRDRGARLARAPLGERRSRTRRRGVAPAGRVLAAGRGGC